MGQAYTIGGVVEEAARHLKKNGIEEAKRTAQLLMQHILKVEMAELLSRSRDELSPDLFAQYSGLIRRRLSHEPLQYITRRVEFWSLSFHIDPRAAIPRPETEHVVEQVLADFSDKDEPLKIVDVGTGSGVLAIALAMEFPKAQVFGVDIDSGALEVAEINSSRLSVADRVTMLRNDLLAGKPNQLEPDSFDVIVSNPPYISEAEIDTLAPQVARAEPRRALVAGATGLEIYRRLIPQAEEYLVTGGRLYMECGAGRAEAVKRLIEESGSMTHVRTAKDLRKVPRVVVGRKRR